MFASMLLYFDFDFDWTIFSASLGSLSQSSKMMVWGRVNRMSRTPLHAHDDAYFYMSAFFEGRLEMFSSKSNASSS